MVDTDMTARISDFLKEYEENKRVIEKRYTVWTQPVIRNPLIFFQLEKIAKLENQLHALTEEVAKLNQKQCSCRGNIDDKPKRTKKTRKTTTVQD